MPVDPGAPVARGAYILQDCAVKAVLVEAARADRLAAELAGLGATPVLIVVDGLQVAAPVFASPSTRLTDGASGRHRAQRC